MANAVDRTPPVVDDRAKLARLNDKLRTAIDSLDRGEGIEIDDLDAYFDGLMKRVRARQGP